MSARPQLDFAGDSWADSAATLWAGASARNPQKYSMVGWSEVRRWQRQASDNGGVDPRLGRRRRVLLNKRSDFFGPEATQFHEEAWELLRACPDLVFLIATRFPDRALAALPQDWDRSFKHVLLGAQVSCQADVEQMVPGLLAIPTQQRFVLAAPLLADMDLTSVRDPATGAWRAVLDTSGVSWVVVAGDNKAPRPRPTQIAHIRSVVRQCKDAGTPVFVEHLGAVPIGPDGQVHPVHDQRGALMADWPSDLRLRQVPTFGVAIRRSAPLGVAAARVKELGNEWRRVEA